MGSIADSLHELSSLSQCYPAFVTRAAAPQPGEVPVFVFHTIEPDRFAAQLTHLVESGYRTIDPDEYMRILSGAVRGSGREVLLTIDDARSSLWRYAFPLLRRFGCRATTFAITGWTTTSGRRENWDDVEAGRMSAAALAALDARDEQVCTWEELREMQSSGLVTVECHTHLHQRLFCGDSIEGVVLAGSIRTASDAVFSPYLSVADAPAMLPGDAFIGYPLTRTIPLMACKPAQRIHADYAAVFAQAFKDVAAPGSTVQQQQACAQRFIADRGSRLPASAVSKLDASAVRRLAREDLAASQATLRSELRLPQAGRHLCLPFTVGSDAAVEEARALGFATVFWGVSPRRRGNSPGSDPMASVRLKNDFIWRLPGVGRRSLAALYFEKFTRRVAGIAPY